MPAHHWRSKVAYLPTESGWWFDTVGAHFNQIDEQLEQLLEPLGFDADVLEWKISRISSGERQRLALARCLQQSPSALLLDEPTASLGDDHTLALEEIVKKYIAANSAPVFWVSHDMKQLNRIANVKIEILQDGAISVPVV
jgi:ABC-type iron transport system FetAB ATPase subunit